MPVISALGIWRQEEPKFNDTLGYKASLEANLGYKTPPLKQKNTFQRKLGQATKLLGYSKYRKVPSPTPLPPVPLPLYCSPGTPICLQVPGATSN